MSSVYGMKIGIPKLAGLVLASALLATACTAANSPGGSKSGSISVGGSIVTVDGQAAPDVQTQELPDRVSTQNRSVARPAPLESPRAVNPPAGTDSRPVTHDRCSGGFTGHGKVKPMLPMCLSE